MNWRNYPNAVNKPAARIFGYSLAASFGLFEAVALLALWSLNAAARDAAYWYAIAAMLSLFVGGVTGWRSFVILHEDYLDISERRETVTATDHGVFSEQARGIPVNSQPDAIIIRRNAKTVEGVLFQGAWLEQMYTAMTDGNNRFTRDASGISGSAYPQCREALSKAGYIDDNQEYTPEGRRWLATK